jgi:small conductance mechanosensitive channel
MRPLDPLLNWLAGRGLEIVLLVLGSVLLARFISWVGEKITDRIDARATTATRWCARRRPSTGTR